MSKIAVVTDSNSGITQNEAKDLGLVVVPMPFTIDGEEFLEDITMTQDEFYVKLLSGADVMTSQPSRDYLENLWNELLQTYDEIVYIPTSSGLSGTCENAKNYATSFNGKVYVVDNSRISVTLKESALEAKKMVEDGYTAQEIKKHLEETGKNNSIYIMVDTLKYLKKGGRISKASAMLGEMFKLKPILTSNGGAFEKYNVAFSPEQAKKKMIQRIKQELDTKYAEQVKNGEMVISLAHTNCEDKIKKFKEEVENTFKDIPVHFMDPLALSVVCHIGAGAIAVAICQNSHLK